MPAHALGEGISPAYQAAGRGRATCQTSVRCGWSRPPLCRKNGGCAWGTPPRTPAKSRCAWRGGGDRSAGFRANRRRSARCGPRGGRRRSGGCVGTARDPPPAFPGLFLPEAPAFIECEPVAVLAGQPRVLLRGQGLDFSPRPDHQGLAADPEGARDAARAHAVLVGGDPPAPLNLWS